jgi:hypothetical protein
MQGETAGNGTLLQYLPTIAILCLQLNSSSNVDQNHMQMVFARMYFFNCAKLLPFPILHKNYIMSVMTCPGYFVRQYEAAERVLTDPLTILVYLYSPHICMPN